MAAADRVRDRVDVHLERRRLDLGHHPAAVEKPQIAAVRGRRLVLGMLPRESREVRAAARLGRQLEGPGLDVGLVLVPDAQQDLAGAHLPRGRVLPNVRVVVLLDFLFGGGDALEDGGFVDEQELELALLRHFVRQRLLFVVRRDLVVGGRHLVEVVVAAECDHLDPDPLVPPPVLVGDLLVGDGNPSGDGRLQPFEHDVAAHFLLELRWRHRRPLQLQRLAVTRLADELAVHLEPRQVDDPVAHLRVAHGQSESLRFRHGRVAGDHALQDLAVDSQRPEHLLGHLARRLAAVVLELQEVHLAELGHRDAVVADLRHDVVGKALHRRLVHESGNVEEHEREADEGEAPLEPPLVPPHAVKHRHGAVDCTRVERVLSSTGGARGGSPFSMLYLRVLVGVFTNLHEARSP